MQTLYLDSVVAQQEGHGFESWLGQGFLRGAWVFPLHQNMHEVDFTVSALG